MATFLASLTTPAGTQLTAPASQVVQTIAGELLALRLFVPPGPRGELYLRLMHGGVQLAPARVGTWWRPDNTTITVPLDAIIHPGDTKFYLEGASPHANFEHTVDFELLIDPDSQFAPASNQSSIVSRIAALFGGS